MVMVSCQTKATPKPPYVVALHFMYGNFVRVHHMLKITPALAEKVADKLWEIGDIVMVFEE